MTAVWVALVVVGAVLLITVVPAWVATLGPHCRCGHHRSVHRGPGTECAGTWPTGRNAVGAKQRQWCPCQAYRPTAVGYWDRVLHGAEGHQP